MENSFSTPIKFDAHRSPRNAGSEHDTPTLHPRIADAQHRTTEEIVDTLSHQSTLAPADIAGVLRGLKDYFVSELSAGHTVHLDGIGALSIVPRFTRPVLEGEPYNGRDVAVKSVHFATDRRLLATVRYNARFVKGRTYEASAATLDDARRYVGEYLATHDYLLTEHLERGLDLKRTKATRFLKALTEEGFVVKSKRHGLSVYTLPESGEE